MRNLIGFKTAGNLVLAALALVAAFHVLVLVGVFPADIVWGGQVSGAETAVYETVALVEALAFMIIIATRAGYLRRARTNTFAAAGTWFIFFYLLLNTFLNLISGSTAEKLVFAPITLAMALLTYRLAIEESPRPA